MSHGSGSGTRNALLATAGIVGLGLLTGGAGFAAAPAVLGADAAAAGGAAAAGAGAEAAGAGLMGTGAMDMMGSAGTGLAGSVAPGAMDAAAGGAAVGGTTYPNAGAGELASVGETHSPMYYGTGGSATGGPNTGLQAALPKLDKGMTAFMRARALANMAAPQQSPIGAPPPAPPPRPPIDSSALAALMNLYPQVNHDPVRRA